MSKCLWATCTKNLAIYAEVAKEMFWVGLFSIWKILNSFSFNYLNSIPRKRTCNLERKDLMTRMNPAVPVKTSRERGLPNFICASQTFLVVLKKNHVSSRFLNLQAIRYFRRCEDIWKHLKTEGGTLYIHVGFLARKVALKRSHCRAKARRLTHVTASRMERWGWLAQATSL